MDWKFLSLSFVTIFLAELGDKTQLATLSLAAGSTSRWAVFLGAALALIATTAIAVLLGEAIRGHIPALWMRRGAGLLFVLLGLIFLFGTAPA